MIHLPYKIIISAGRGAPFYERRVLLPDDRPMPVCKGWRLLMAYPGLNPDLPQPLISHVWFCRCPLVPGPAFLKPIFMRLSCLFLLLAPLGLLGQSAPYYLGDGLSDFSDQMIRGTNPVSVTFFGTDSPIISTNATAYEHASVYKRTAGEPFLRRTAEWGTSLPNYVFLYEKAIFLVEKGGSYLLFHKDHNSANALLSAEDKSPIVRMKDKYHLNGKCFVQWRVFGYEALGAAKFTTDMYTYNNNDSYIQASGPDGSLRLEEGVAYEIECD